MSQITRRVFLRRAGLAVAATLLLAGLWPRKRLQCYVERVIDLIWGPRRRLQHHFSYLDLDPVGVDQYVRDFETVVGRLSRFRVWPSDVYTRYLLSTDFFVHDADEAHRVRYLWFYRPNSACSNPFAQFD